MQDALFYECFDDALRAIVQAAGGTKAVGGKLRPNKSPDEAGRWLANCLNSSRPEHLEPDDLLHILRIGRAVGCHSGMNYLAQDTGYRCEVIDPADEQAALMRQYVEAAKLMQQLGARIERNAAPAIHLKSVA